MDFVVGKPAWSECQRALVTPWSRLLLLLHPLLLLLSPSLMCFFSYFLLILHSLSSLNEPIPDIPFLVALKSEFLFIITFFFFFSSSFIYFFSFFFLLFSVSLLPLPLVRYISLSLPVFLVLRRTKRSITGRRYSECGGSFLDGERDDDAKDREGKILLLVFCVRWGELLGLPRKLPGKFATNRLASNVGWVTSPGARPQVSLRVHSSLCYLTVWWPLHSTSNMYIYT